MVRSGSSGRSKEFSTFKTSVRTHSKNLFIIVALGLAQETAVFVCESTPQILNRASVFGASRKSILCQTRRPTNPFQRTKRKLFTWFVNETIWFNEEMLFRTRGLRIGTCGWKGRFCSLGKRVSILRRFGRRNGITGDS